MRNSHIITGRQTSTEESYCVMFVRDFVKTYPGFHAFSYTYVKEVGDRLEISLYKVAGGHAIDIPAMRAHILKWIDSGKLLYYKETSARWILQFALNPNNSYDAEILTRLNSSNSTRINNG